MPIGLLKLRYLSTQETLLLVVEHHFIVGDACIIMSPPSPPPFMAILTANNQIHSFIQCGGENRV